MEKREVMENLWSTLVEMMKQYYTYAMCIKIRSAETSGVIASLVIPSREWNIENHTSHRGIEYVKIKGIDNEINFSFTDTCGINKKISDEKTYYEIRTTDVVVELRFEDVSDVLQQDGISFESIKSILGHGTIND